MIIGLIIGFFLGLVLGLSSKFQLQGQVDLTVTDNKILLGQYSKNVDKTVKKLSGKPFKSRNKTNTVVGVVPHPITSRYAYVFKEDDSVVECRMCEVVL